MYDTYNKATLVSVLPATTYINKDYLYGGLQALKHHQFCHAMKDFSVQVLQSYKPENSKS